MGLAQRKRREMMMENTRERAKKMIFRTGNEFDKGEIVFKKKLLGRVRQREGWEKFTKRNQIEKEICESYLFRKDTRSRKFSVAFHFFQHFFFCSCCGATSGYSFCFIFYFLIFILRLLSINRIVSQIFFKDLFRLF